MAFNSCATFSLNLRVYPTFSLLVDLWLLYKERCKTVFMSQRSFISYWENVWVKNYIPPPSQHVTIRVVRGSLEWEDPVVIAMSPPPPSDSREAMSWLPPSARLAKIETSPPAMPPFTSLGNEALEAISEGAVLAMHPPPMRGSNDRCPPHNGRKAELGGLRGTLIGPKMALLTF
jgi:hypothetical protein